MTLSFAGIIYSSPAHHYDHIASLCLFLDIPLVVTDEETERFLQEIYPSLIIYCFDYLTLGHEVVSRFNVLLSCHPRPYLEKMFSFSEELLNKKCTTFFIPHGNSDKGHQSKLMEGIQYEKLVGVYGKKMIEFFAEKGVLTHLFGTVHLGNYREKIYATFKPHFQKILQKQITLPAGKRVILFTPTWEDDEQSCSLFSIIDTLLEKKPDDVALIVKPHPNTFLMKGAEMERLQGKIDRMDDVFFIRDFPPIYALLDIANVYLGDMSSIGYDFLTYNRPMFFLNPNKRDHRSDRGLQLMRCGEVIYPENYDAIYEIMEHPQTELKKVRHEMYTYTFGDPVTEAGMKQEFTRLTEQFIHRSGG